MFCNFFSCNNILKNRRALFDKFYTLSVEGLPLYWLKFWSRDDRIHKKSIIIIIQHHWNWELRKILFAHIYTHVDAEKRKNLYRKGARRRTIYQQCEVYACAICHFNNHVFSSFQLFGETSSRERYHQLLLLVLLFLFSLQSFFLFRDI